MYTQYKMASEEERRKVMDIFEQMGAMPKGNTPEEIQDWMKEFLASKEKEEDKVKVETLQL